MLAFDDNIIEHIRPFRVEIENIFIVYHFLELLYSLVKRKVG